MSFCSILAAWTMTALLDDCPVKLLIVKLQNCSTRICSILSEEATKQPWENGRQCRTTADMINRIKISMLITRISLTYWITYCVFFGKSVPCKPTSLMWGCRSAKVRERNINFLTTVCFKVHWCCSLNDESKPQVQIVFLLNRKNSMLLF